MQTIPLEAYHPNGDQGSISAADSVYPSKDPKYQRFASRRSTVHSTKGIISSTQPLACRTGIRILEQGGNAADAAVATAAALNITEPCSTGIGGDAFCLFYDAKTKKTHALNGSGRSPLNYTREQMLKDLNIPKGGDVTIPWAKVQSVTVPGTAAAWVDTVAKFGSGNLSMMQILQPAIELGEEGFPVSFLTSRSWQLSEQLLKGASPNFAEMLKLDSKAKDGCRAPRAGEIFSNPSLARTFRTVAEEGKKGFYEGRIGEEIVKICKSLGGRLDLEDLKNHMELGTEEVEAISMKFSGQGIAEPIELWEHPPNGQGLVALIALGVFQELEKAGKIKRFTPQDFNSTEYLHAIIECLRLGFADGIRYIADPAKEHVPIKELLSSSYLAKRASDFNPSAAIPKITHGEPFSACDTVYLSTADNQGNACSFIQSNYAGFGTGIIPKGCGFTLQNRGNNFNLEVADHPNVYAPGKRPFHTIIPSMVTNVKDQSLYACYGVMGGFMQPQGHLQVLLNLTVFGHDPQEALDAPRICIEPGQGKDDVAGRDTVLLEEGIPEETVQGLKRLGHKVRILRDLQRPAFGRGQIIRRTVDDGKLVLSAGSDPRGDGQASPL